MGKLKNIDSVLDASSADTPEVVHLRSVNPTNEKGKKKKKSSNTLNQKIAAPSGTNVGEENRGDLRDLCEEFKAEFFSGQHIQSPLISEHGGVSLTEKDGNPLQEANTTLSSQGEGCGLYACAHLFSFSLLISVFSSFLSPVISKKRSMLRKHLWLTFL